MSMPCYHLSFVHLLYLTLTSPCKERTIKDDGRRPETPSRFYLKSDHESLFLLYASFPHFLLKVCQFSILFPRSQTGLLVGLLVDPMVQEKVCQEFEVNLFLAYFFRATAYVGWIDSFVHDMGHWIFTQLRLTKEKEIFYILLLVPTCYCHDGS